MEKKNEKIPDPKEIERELGEFLAKKFGGDVKIVSPLEFPQKQAREPAGGPEPKPRNINFDLKPEQLISYLDQYIVRQDSAKEILATKVCTHFNRIKHQANHDDDFLVGGIKNNILLIGPTGVGKTYIIKLISKKLGVPFVKGDATKFSETGYVGGDVEDLVRDLVREADGDIELAENGIIYIDEIDKIASSRNLVGSDISRTGVQRALLKPMEETDVELKTPHDPISMMQEIEKFRKTGKRDSRTINTRNILFIMSGAFGELGSIIGNRLSKQQIGFGARIVKYKEQDDILKHVHSEDLIRFGFETEFVGRLPVIAVLHHLSQEDLYEILINPNNPVILGKRLDFASYGVDIKFQDAVLRKIAEDAYKENTGARGLVSAVEKTLIKFEKTLPSRKVDCFPVSETMLEDVQKSLDVFFRPENKERLDREFENLVREEKAKIVDYLNLNKKVFSEKYSMAFTHAHIDMIASLYSTNIMEIDKAVRKIKHYLDEVKNIELLFYKNHDINIVLEDDAVGCIITELTRPNISLSDIYRRLEADFELGLKLVRDKTGKNRFFITKTALSNPESYIETLIRDEMQDPMKEVEA